MVLFFAHFGLSCGKTIPIIECITRLGLWDLYVPCCTYPQCMYLKSSVSGPLPKRTTVNLNIHTSIGVRTILSHLRLGYIQFCHSDVICGMHNFVTVMSWGMCNVFTRELGSHIHHYQNLLEWSINNIIIYHNDHSPFIPPFVSWTRMGISR